MALFAAADDDTKSSGGGGGTLFFASEVAEDTAESTAAKEEISEESETPPTSATTSTTPTTTTSTTTQLFDSSTLQEASDALTSVGWAGVAPMQGEGEMTSEDPFVKLIDQSVQEEMGVGLDQLLNPAKVSQYIYSLNIMDTMIE